MKAPIEEGLEDSEKIITEIFNGIEYGVSLSRLLALSPSLLREVKKILSKKRVPVQLREALEQVLVEMEQTSGETIEGSEEMIPGVFVQPNAVYLKDLPYLPELSITKQQEGLVPMGSVIVNDAIVQYWLSIPAGEQPKQVFVSMTDIQRAGDSAALRVVYPLIQGSGEVESILDGGSQIVSMAQATAVELGIGWDPDTFIYMQSANGQTEKSVGLAKNVPFCFGDITVYLQVHIIKEPAYKVLLGRPFEILTASMVNNKTDGSQILTLTDPANQKRVVVPTFARGQMRQIRRTQSAPAEAQHVPVEQNFQNSRI